MNIGIKHFILSLLLFCSLSALAQSGSVTSGRYASSSVLSSGKWVRVSVNDNGIHKITDLELKNMGFSNPSNVRIFGYGGHQLPEVGIENLSDDLQEVPVLRANGYLLFYANGTVSWEYKTNRFVHTRNVYSESGSYFLTEGGSPATFPVLSVSGEPQKEITTYPDYYVIDNDKNSHCKYGRVLVDDYDYTSGRTRTYDIPITDVADSTGVIDLSFATNGASSSRVKITVGNSTPGTLSISSCTSGEVGKLTSGRYTLKRGVSDNMTIKLSQEVNSSTVNGHLDYLSLNYTRRLTLRGSQTTFRGSDENDTLATYHIDGCNSNVHVWNLTTKTPQKVEGTLTGSHYTFVAPSGRNNEFVVFDIKGKFPSVTVEGEVPNQNLHSFSQADMVIIIPSNGQLKNPAERLASAHREIDSLSVVVVTARQLYNEFSSGTPDVTAYRRFMKMLYDRASSAEDAPRYLLMFGDSWYDNRLITIPNASQDDYLLCFESKNSVNAVRSYVLEDYMGLLDDGEGNNFLRNKVDVGVGRIPVTSVSAANAVVDKIIRYMQNGDAGAWQNVITLLADDGDIQIPNQHMIDSEGVASVLNEAYPSYVVDRIYWDNYPAEKSAVGLRYPEVTRAIKERMNKGSLVVSYYGHGSSNLLSHEMTWKASDMAELSSPRLALWMVMACDIAPFDKNENSFAEAALMNPVGGAIAVFTSTRTALQNYNAVLGKEFMKQLLSPVRDGKNIAVGDAVRAAKCRVIELGSDLSENKLQYVLLGDPALRLKYPDCRVRVDKVNGMPVGEMPQITAGSVLNVEGCVVDNSNEVSENFTGKLYSCLFDGIREVNTRNNTGLGVFKYSAHDKMLYEGSDSVRNGCFNITLQVPMNISYSDTVGRLNFIAVDNTATRMAQGHFDGFTVGGTSPDFVKDGNGPDIKLYLNYSSFKDGGKVNPAPCLFVELFDENGINRGVAGLGHDIMAVVDNDQKHTYNLNGLYTSVGDDYRYGTIVLPLDTLSEGEHTLQLRAWDMHNNSSVAKVGFEVDPQLLTIKDFETDSVYYRIVDEQNFTVIVTSANEEKLNIVIPQSVLYNNIQYSVVGFCENAFAECGNLMDIKISIRDAIMADGSIFAEDAYNNAVLYVPAGSKASYENVEPWCRFANIVELDSTGIGDVYEQQDADVLYDLTGRVVERPVRGVYIKNGKKVLVK